MKKPAHFALLLEYGRRFTADINAVLEMREHVATHGSNTTLQQLQIMEQKLNEKLLDLHTLQEIEEAQRAYKNLPAPKPKAAPKTRVKKTKVAIVRSSTEAQVIAAKMDREWLGKNNKFATRQSNHIIPVRIDEKTTILIEPGRDPEEARKAYFAKYTKSLKDTIKEKWN